MSAALAFDAPHERGFVMQTLHEAHVLTLYAGRLAEVQAHRQNRRIVAAVRAQRRADRAARRARRLLALAGLS